MDFCGFLLCPSYAILESTETTFQTQEVSRNKEYTILTQMRQGLSYGTIQPHPTPAKQAMWKFSATPTSHIQNWLTHSGYFKAM